MIIDDAKLLLGGYDISSDANKVMVNGGFAQEPNSRFGDRTEVFANGVRRTGVMAEGFYRAALDAVLRAKFDAGGALMSVFAVAATVGDAGDAIRINAGEYAPLPDAAWGKALAFAFRGYALGARYSARYLASGTKTVSGAGAALFIPGGVPTGKKLYGGLHVLGVSGIGATLDATVTSDAAADFATPTTRVTHAQQSALGDSLPAGVAGPITDEYFRFEWALGGVNPSIPLFAWLAIQR